jgi:hypothetical protein
MRSWIPCVACLLATACLPRERLNSNCAWRGDSTFVVDMPSDVHRTHLTLDVRLAEELGIRHGDSFKRTVPLSEAWVKGQRCTAASLAIVERLHTVSKVEIEAVTGTRDLGIDIATIFLPTVILLAFAADRIVRRVHYGFEPEERWPKIFSLLALAPIVAGMGAVAAHLWSWGVDSIRLWDSHLSYRAIRLPIGQHALASWAVGVVVFAAVAVYRLPSLAGTTIQAHRHAPPRGRAAKRI